MARTFGPTSGAGGFGSPGRFPGSSGTEAPGSAGIPTGGGGAGPAPLPPGGGGGGWNLPSLPTPNRPDSPDLPPINPEAEFDPELEAYREQFKGHIGNLETGTGHAMDVMRQQQQDAADAEYKRLEEMYAGQGIPMDPERVRAEAQRNINASMAQEKLGREKMMTEAYTSGLPIIAEPARERFNRLGLDLQRDVAEVNSILDLYGTDMQGYLGELGSLTSSNNAMLGLYGALMSGMFGMMGNMGSGMSQSTSYGGGGGGGGGGYAGVGFG